jgi:hypothetical protein
MKSKWYLANIIEYPIIIDKKTGKEKKYINYLYWDDLVLIKAINTEKAYRKACIEGKLRENSYINSEGHRVKWKFAGLRELVMIHDEIEDCAELACYQGNVKSIKYIKRFIPQKNKLTVFTNLKKKNKEKIDKKI